MIADMGTYRKTRWPGVFYRGDVLYYRLRLADGTTSQIKYGAEGSPADAARARDLAQERENRIRAGLLDAREAVIDSESVRPISEVLEEYQRHLKGKGNTDDRHLKTTVRYLERCIDWCGIQRLRDFDAGKVDKWLETFKGRRPPAVAVKGLLNWAVVKGKLKWNPLAALRLAEAKPTRTSRSLARAEFDALLQSAKRKRPVFYRLAVETGLRWREIARLTWGDIDLEDATVRIQNRKGDRLEILPLPESCVVALEKIRPKRADPNARAISREPRLRTWKEDLERAGVKYSTPAGNADRKCLRMTYCTWLYKAGVDLRDAQRLMRHTDPKLTAKVYTDIRLEDLRGAQARALATPPKTEQKGQVAG